MIRERYQLSDRLRGLCRQHTDSGLIAELQELDRLACQLAEKISELAWNNAALREQMEARS